MSDDGKLVFLFLLTHPHMTALGAMRATCPGLAAELGWLAKRFLSAAQQCISQGLVEANEKASWIGIPKFLRYNEPEGPNSVSKAWVTALDMLPECTEKGGLVKRCRTYLETKSDAFKHAMGDAIWDAFGGAKSEPYRIQEQEQEQERDSPSPPVGATTVDVQYLTPEKVQARWNDIPGVKVCQSLGPTIRNTIRTRLQKHPDPDWWATLFDKVRMSHFLTGQTNGAKETFRATLDWAMGTKNLDKILAGNYDPPPNGMATTVNGKPVLCSFSTKRNGRIAACTNSVTQQPGFTNQRRICADHLAEEEQRRAAVLVNTNAAEGIL